MPYCQSDLFPVLVDVFKGLCVVDSEDTKEALSRAHVLVSHCTEIQGNTSTGTVIIIIIILYSTYIALDQLRMLSGALHTQ